MEQLAQHIVQLHGLMGPRWFLLLSFGVSAVLCLVVIPVTTDLMVNHAAGLGGRWFGRRFRTLIINASTNNPEAATMTVSMISRRMGGRANPLGSLLANCYLMYIVAVMWVLLRFVLARRFGDARRLIGLLWHERRLVAWHVVVALGAVAVGSGALILMGRSADETTATVATTTETVPSAALPATGWSVWAALGCLVVGTMLFFVLERKLKKQRPELFSDIDDSDHGHSVLWFLLGTAGLIIACWFMNVLFLAWSTIYRSTLEGWFGVSVFAGLHLVLGALITSLPELRVATTNYRKLTVPDLNTALAGASYSNLTNLVVALIGLAVYAGLLAGGTHLPWE